MKSAPAPHPYVGDGITDHTGADRCRRCGYAKAKAWHVMPEVDPAVGVVEARRVGEPAEGGG